jgi:hypothetical protein
MAVSFVQGFQVGKLDSHELTGKPPPSSSNYAWDITFDPPLSLSLLSNAELQLLRKSTAPLLAQVMAPAVKAA